MVLHFKRKIMQMSWHKFGQTVEAVARWHKNFVHPRCCCTRGRKIAWKNFFFVSRELLFCHFRQPFHRTTRSVNDRYTRRKYKMETSKRRMCAHHRGSSSELSRSMEYGFVIGNTLKAIVEFVIHEMVRVPLSCLPRYSFVRA